MSTTDDRTPLNGVTFTLRSGIVVTDAPLERLRDAGIPVYPSEGGYGYDDVQHSALDIRRLLTEAGATETS